MRTEERLDVSVRLLRFPGFKAGLGGTRSSQRHGAYRSRAGDDWHSTGQAGGVSSPRSGRCTLQLSVGSIEMLSLDIVMVWI